MEELNFTIGNNRIVACNDTDNGYNVTLAVEWLRKMKITGSIRQQD